MAVARPSLASLVNDISDCLEALENEASTQGSAGDAVAARMRTLLPALLDTTDGVRPWHSKVASPQHKNARI